MRHLILIALFLPTVAVGCPDDPDYGARVDQVIGQFAKAPTHGAARDIHNRMWQALTQAPDTEAQDLLDAGMERIQMGDLSAAGKAINALISYCPDFSEGYNQRALIRFLQQDYAGALPDLDLTLDMVPNHLGALTGKAMTLMALGREEEAQDLLRQALALNPWMAERRLIKEPQGEDI